MRRAVTVPHVDAGRASTDTSIAAIAETQLGLITLAQLESTGLTSSAIRKRAIAGRLYRVHRGVYSVGHQPLTLDSEKMAAVLACGPGAVLSHGSAAALWRLRAEPGRPFHVTALNRWGRGPAGIRAHQYGSLRPDDCSSFRGIPCTTVARTLLDLAGEACIDDLERTVSEAEVLRFLDLKAIEALIARSANRRGVARLRRVIGRLVPSNGSPRSHLERRFLTMCERVGLPQPEVNQGLHLEGELLVPDFMWRDARLIVETDGREVHGTASAFENDRLRDQTLSLGEWLVIHCTWHQVTSEPLRLSKMIQTLFSRRARNGTHSPVSRP